MAKPYSGDWEFNFEKDRQGSCSHGVDISARDDKQINKHDRH